MSRKKAARRPIKKSPARTKRVLFGYPLVVFLLLCAGVFLLLATFPSLADDMHVTAKVSGPLVTDPAVITSPAEGARFSSVPINVTGTCPTNAAYVEIFHNGVMGGSTICDSDGNFQLSIDLTPNLNSLTAHAFNFTDDEGPVSNVVNVTYDVPQTPSPTASGGGEQSSGQSNPQAPSASPLLAMTTFVYKGYHLGDLVEWPVEISGGQAPYTANVDWGDSTHTIYNRDIAGVFTVFHRYQKLPRTNKSFNIKVTISDAVGSQTFFQFFVLVTSSIASAPSASIFSKPVPSINSHNWLWLAWPAYTGVTLMVFSYWLGEREEMIILKKKGRLKRPLRR